MEVICSTCKRKIEAEHVNIDKDTAFCTSCENLTSLSLLVESTPNKSFNANAPVNEISVDDLGYKWKVSVSHRSWLAFFFSVFAVAWAVGAFPAVYGGQNVSGGFDVGPSLSGLPFLIVGVIFVSYGVVGLFGYTTISVENGKALVFVGVGSIGWSRRFDWQSIDRVIEHINGKYEYLSLEGGKRINLGWGFGAEKRYFIVNFLRGKLQK